MLISIASAAILSTAFIFPAFQFSSNDFLISWIYRGSVRYLLSRNVKLITGTLCKCVLPCCSKRLFNAMQMWTLWSVPWTRLISTIAPLYGPLFAAVHLQWCLLIYKHHRTTFVMRHCSTNKVYIEGSNWSVNSLSEMAISILQWQRFEPTNSRCSPSNEHGQCCSSGSPNDAANFQLLNTLISQFFPLLHRSSLCFSDRHSKSD